MSTSRMGAMFGVSMKIGLLFCLLFPSSVYGHPGGAPKTACADMKPVHGSSIPQAPPNPYELTPDITEVKGGDTVTLTLSGAEEHKGFLIRIGKVGTVRYDGKWTKGDDVGTTDCDREGYVATHRRANDKMDTEVVWTAPNEDGEYEIFFTVAKDEDIYWVKDSAGTITVHGISGGKNMTISSSLLTVVLVMTSLAILGFSSDKFL